MMKFLLVALLVAVAVNAAFVPDVSTCDTCRRGLSFANIYLQKKSLPLFEEEKCLQAGLCVSGSSAENSREKLLSFLKRVILTSNDCNPTYITYGRTLYSFLPTDYKDQIKNQLLLVLTMQVNKIPYQVLEDFVMKQLFEGSFPAERVCEIVSKTILPEWNRRQACTESCMDRIDLSWERLLKLALKCQTDLMCYLSELQEDIMKVQECSDECYGRP